ncbi:conserved unknown protein [Ectocarpus siliculosus]|uniref:DNA endonuclease activator Ctp1 C-terminal domain-containing protein n=1 Tax=Ectocarpus siliculosus TaxID=2880 RepID=D7G5G7_ECTSI|nr:conserved unknown protein [Ectocarpus siliculosus]|eukprot:CBJ27290.1 conserved unknown protein [Ectocarpus siliculosus]
MSALQNINGLNGVGENQGRDQQQPQHEQGGGGGGEGGHLLLSASQKAIRDLAYALEKDSDGWHSEREKWAKERAALEASLGYKESHMQVLKKENKRLARVVGDAKRENERLARESSRLRDEKADLLARNARLDARNLEVRKQIEALAERNRKLKATVERELLDDINPNSAASGNSNNSKRPAAVDRRPQEAASSSVQLEGGIQSIVVPNPRRRPAETIAPSRGSNASTHRRRRRRSENSDTDEVVTPRSTAPGEDHEPPPAVTAASTRNHAEAVGQGVKGWRLATEAAKATHTIRQGSGMVEAAPRAGGKGGHTGGEGGETRGSGRVESSPLEEECKGATARDDEVLPGFDSRHRASPHGPHHGQGLPSGERRRIRRDRSRKRSRLSLGGGAEERPYTSGGRAVEITEVLDAPRPRSSAARSGRASPDSRPGHSSRNEVKALDKGPMSKAKGKEQPLLDGPTAGARPGGNSDGIQTFPGALLAAERIGSSRDGVGSRAGVGGLGEGRRPGTMQVARKHQRRPTKQASHQQTPPRPVLDQQGGKGGNSSSASSSTVSSMRISQNRSDSDHVRKNEARLHRDLDQLGRKNKDTFETSAMREGLEGERVVAGGDDDGGGSDAGTASSTGHDVVYPRLTMAAVNSPRKKKPGQRRQHHQHQHQQDATVVSSAGADCQGYERRKGGPVVGDCGSDGGALGGRLGEVGRLPSPPRLLEANDRGGTRGSDRIGNAGARKDELPVEGSAGNEKPAPPEHSNGGASHQRRLPKPTEIDTPGEEVGGKERVGSSSKNRAAAAATAVARHQVVANPYATAGVTSRGGAGRGGERARDDKPPNYKFQEVVRDRSKRAMMKGHDCEHCAAYLAAVGGSPGEREAILNMCSRHKYTEANGRPAETPDGFWDLSFADSIDPDKH